MKAPNFIRIESYWNDKPISELQEKDMISLSFGKERARSTVYIVKNIKKDNKKKTIQIELIRKYNP